LLPQDDLEDNAEKQLLMDIVNSLNTREKQIIVMRFGLGGVKEMTQKEVADSMGISQSYISRIEKRLVNKIRKEMLKRA